MGFAAAESGFQTDDGTIRGFKTRKPSQYFIDQQF